jgi:hypothetical protein
VPVFDQDSKKSIGDTLEILLKTLADFYEKCGEYRGEETRLPNVSDSI